MNPIKVLVISNYRDNHNVRPEASIFLALAKMNFEITIMTYGNAGYIPQFKEAGIHVIDFHPVKKFDKTEIAFIRQTIIERKIDIIQLFNNAAIINGIKAAQGLDVKVVLYRGYSANINWWDPTAYYKFLNPRVDKIFCNSRGVEEHIQRQLFFDKSKTITINKGHNLDWYKDIEPFDMREKLGISKDALLLINVANNRRMKGIPYLLQAINALPNNLDVHLLLVGENMETPENLKIISQSNKSKNIHFLGYQKDVLNIVAACDCFVLTSIKGESITKSVIEAMSMQVTPIISDIAGNRELVVNNECGLVFKSKSVEGISDCIQKVYNNRAWCKELGIKAKEHIRTHLNTETTALKTKALYEELVAKKK